MVLYFIILISYIFIIHRIGFSINTLANKNNNTITRTIEDIKFLLYEIPNIVPVIPQIENPKFNYQPFQGIKSGIKALQVPYKFKGNTYKLKLKFPKLQCLLLIQWQVCVVYGIN